MEKAFQSFQTGKAFQSFEKVKTSKIPKTSIQGFAQPLKSSNLEVCPKLKSPPFQPPKFNFSNFPQFNLLKLHSNLCLFLFVV
jgi:hypothetical protein